MPTREDLHKLTSPSHAPRQLQEGRGPLAAPRARRALRLASTLALPLLLSACPPQEPSVRSEGCPRCAVAERIGTLPKGPIDECSGVAVSRTHPGVLYVHNDSGDDPRFFAIGLDGTEQSRIDVARATAIDWEDVAYGSCGPEGGNCLYFADIGDNDRVRDTYTLYRVKEPDTLEATGTALAQAFTISYPDGRFDAETLLIHPTTGMITIVTKVKKGAARVYELPELPAPGGSAVLVPAGMIWAPAGDANFTSGDVHPDGIAVLLRTTTHVFYYPMSPDQTVAEAIATPPCLLSVAKEEQGEAIAWLPGGMDYVMIGEGDQAPIHRVTCEAPKSPEAP